MVIAAMKLKDANSLGQPRQHIKKQRHYFADKGHYCQGYGCDFFQESRTDVSWTIKKAGHQRIDAFKLWC